MQVFSIGGGTMLEVVFSDSEKGSMKAAKNYNAKTMLGGAIGYFGKKPTNAELEKYFEGQAVNLLGYEAPDIWEESIISLDNA
jgi:hypothetical protein